MFHKLFFSLSIPSLLYTFTLSCKKNLDSSSEVAESLEVDSDVALKEDVAIRVNTRTNYLFVYKKGIAILKWRIASGKPHGKTPEGVFEVHDKKHCPPWNNGKKGDDERKADGCDKTNPLGEHVLWFFQNTIYGLHGVNTAPTDENGVSSGMKSVTASIAAERSVSMGCIRNHPENAKWLFDNIPLRTKVVIESSPIDPSTAVDCFRNEAKKCDTEWNSTSSTSSTADGIQIPNSLNAHNPAQTSGLTTSVVPKTFPTGCNIRSNGGSNVLTNVRITYAMPRLSADKTDTLQAGAKILLENPLTGESVGGDTRWYNISYTLQGQKKTAFIPVSSVTCEK